MSPLMTAALVLVAIGSVTFFCSEKAGKAATVFWWTGIVLALFGLILFLCAVVLYLAGPVQGVIGAHG